MTSTHSLTQHIVIRSVKLRAISSSLSVRCPLLSAELAQAPQMAPAEHAAASHDLDHDRSTQSEHTMSELRQAPQSLGRNLVLRKLATPHRIRRSRQPS